MKWNKTILYLYPNMQDCFSRSYYRWFFLKSCKYFCFQREVSHTGSSRTAGAQIGEKRFALFDCVTQLWCFVAPSSHWKFWKKFVALIKLSLFWFEFNYHFPRQRPYPISTPMDRENYTQVFIICCRVTTWFTAGPEFVVWTPCVPQPLSTEDQKTSRSTCST